MIAFRTSGKYLLHLSCTWPASISSDCRTTELGCSLNLHSSAHSVHRARCSLTYASLIDDRRQLRNRTGGGNANKSIQNIDFYLLPSAKCIISMKRKKQQMFVSKRRLTHIQTPHRSLRIQPARIDGQRNRKTIIIIIYVCRFFFAVHHHFRSVGAMFK